MKPILMAAALAALAVPALAEPAYNPTFYSELDTRKNRMILAGYDVSAGRAISFWPDRYDPGPI